MNSDHRDNIGTHPAFSQDPETRLRARLEAATRRRNEADAEYTKARNNLRVFLGAQPLPSSTIEDEQESKPSRLYNPALCSDCRDRGEACGR